MLSAIYKQQLNSSASKNKLLHSKTLLIEAYFSLHPHISKIIIIVHIVFQ